MAIRIGDRGLSVTPLRPAGEAVFAGDRHPVRCPEGWVDAGAEVVVVAVDAFGLLVRPGASLPAGSPLPGYGEVVPTAAETAHRREAAESQVRSGEWRIAERSGQWDSLVVGAFVVVVFGVTGGLGYGLAGEIGFKVGLGTGVVLIALLTAWVNSSG